MVDLSILFYEFCHFLINDPFLKLTFTHRNQPLIAFKRLITYLQVIMYPGHFNDTNVRIKVNLKEEPEQKQADEINLLTRNV